MPDTLMKKEPTQPARDAGTAVAQAGARVKDGITHNRFELLILVGTVAFVVVMALVGAALISVG